MVGGGASIGAASRGSPQPEVESRPVNARAANRGGRRPGELLRDRKPINNDAFIAQPGPSLRGETMAKVVVLADVLEEHPARVAFSERVLAEHLTDSHYANQLIERLGWAGADAEALELRLPAPERWRRAGSRGRRPARSIYCTILIRMINQMCTAGLVRAGSAHGLEVGLANLGKS
jgi:hypothetical protein